MGFLKDIIKKAGKVLKKAAPVIIGGAVGGPIGGILGGLGGGGGGGGAPPTPLPPPPVQGQPVSLAQPSPPTYDPGSYYADPGYSQAPMAPGLGPSWLIPIGIGVGLLLLARK